MKYSFIAITTLAKCESKEHKKLNRKTLFVAITHDNCILFEFDFHFKELSTNLCSYFRL
jgi:hypothetical protein